MMDKIAHYFPDSFIIPERYMSRSISSNRYRTCLEIIGYNGRIIGYNGTFKTYRVKDVKFCFEI